MTTRILLTTTSYQDTPGPHHEALEAGGFEIERRRGPLSEAEMIELAGDFDGFLCGDDAITADVIDKCLPRLKVISKYGIGLDKIDLTYATEKQLAVLFTPGVNHTTVAEHALGLLLSLAKKIQVNAQEVTEGKWVAGWKKPVGTEIMGKTLGIVGLGRIGKEVATRARAFGMQVKAYTPRPDEEFCEKYGIEVATDSNAIITESDVISLHCRLDEHTHHLISQQSLSRMRKGAMIINCARGEVVDSAAVAAALHAGTLAGYASDVLDKEPPSSDHPLIGAPNSIITSHIASRTFESVERQAMRATNNLINFLRGDQDFIQANPFN